MLLDALLGLAAVAVVTGFVMREMSIRASDKAIDAQAQAMGQVATGLRKMIGDIQAGQLPLPSSKAGIDWLKPTSCGGAAGNPAEGYVPCAFTGGRLGSVFNTTFIRDPATNAIEIRTTVQLPAPATGDPRRRIVQAESLAQQAMASQNTPNLNSFFTALANVPSTASAPAAGSAIPAAANAGRVTLIVSNAPSTDPWLRVDGTNQMLANLNAGGFSLQNVRDASLSGNLRARGAAQFDNGLTLTSGTADLRAGVVTTDVAYSDIQAYASQGVYSAVVLTGSSTYTVTKPTCNSTASVPTILASIQGVGTPTGSDAIYQARVDVVDTGSSWHITPITTGVKFNLNLSGTTLSMNRILSSTNPSDARVVVLKKCS